MTTVIRFERRGINYAVTFATFDAIAVEVLKVTVPSYCRSWNPIRREWLIEAVYAKPLAEAMARLGHTVVGLESEPKRDDDTAHWARILFKRVGPARSSAVFRSLSRILHPDTPTGDKQLQQELNDAHAELAANTTKGSN